MKAHNFKAQTLKEMLITALFMMIKCPLSTDELMNNYGMIFIMNRNEVVMHAITWIDLRNMLSKRKQLQKTRYRMISIIFGRFVHAQEARSAWEVLRGRRRVN